MIIGQTHKFIFIHVYKVAGTAIRKYLIDNGLGVRGHTVYPQIGENNPHIKAADLRALIPAEVYDGYFKFAFVRNPWDFECSMYNYGVQNDFFPQHELFKSFGSFKRYIKHKYYKHLEWTQSDRYDPNWGQQKDFVTDKDGTVIVDYVGRYELLQPDFRAIRRRIGLPAETPLPVVNSSRHARYTSVYDSASIEHVARIHANDIAAFGYTFDGVQGQGEADAEAAGAA